MDFKLTPEQRELQRSIERFARERLRDPAIVQRDREGVFSRELWAQCGEMALPGLLVPAEYGGAGIDPLGGVLAFEALGEHCEDGGLVFSLGAHLFSCVVPIWKSGTEAQRRRYLPGLCDGTMIAANCITEPAAGSDALAMTTSATRDGDEFVIRGQKCFSTNAPCGDVFLVYAVTDPHRGVKGEITAFIVEAAAHGLSVTRTTTKMGLRTSPMGTVHLDDVRVPASAVLGAVGSGSAELTRSMDWERIGMFAAHVGTMSRLLRRAIDYARTRTQYGEPIGKFQAVSHRLANMRVQLEAARLLTYRGGWRLSQGRNATLEASMTKLFVSEALVRAALDTLQVLGGYGYMAEYGIERILRDSVACTIYSGTSEVQRNIIARWLGLG